MATAVDTASAATAPPALSLGGRRERRLASYPDVERSSLHRALDEGRYQSIVYQMRLGMDPNVRSRQGLTPLMRCARVRPLATSLQLIRALLERGANPDLTDTRGNNLLQLAVKEGNLALAKLLLTENNVNFHHRDADGDTVLHLLASQSAELSRMVLLAARRFHIDCDVVNAEGLTPMMVACRTGNLAVAELLATMGGASFTKRDARYRRTAQDWLLATVGPGGMALKMEQLRRGQESPAAVAAAAAEADPYEKIRHSRRVETLTRLFQSRHASIQPDTAPEEDAAAVAAAASDAPPAAPAGATATAADAEHPDRPTTAAGVHSPAPSSAGSSQRSRVAPGAPFQPPPVVGGQGRLLTGLFSAYELQLSASYRRAAVPLPSAAFSISGVGGDPGLDESRSGSRPVSRVSSGRSMRSPVPTTPGGLAGIGGPAFASGSTMARRMTEFAGTSLRLKHRIRSGVRMSEAGIGSEASAGSGGLLLNTSQDSGGLRRLSSKI